MYTKVIYLLYNGAHYDVFVKKSKDGDIGVFETSDKKTRSDVCGYANELMRMHSEKIENSQNKINH
jgi:hypothetical protein